MQLRSLLALSFMLLGVSAVTCFAAPGGQAQKGPLP